MQPPCPMRLPYKITLPHSDALVFILQLACMHHHFIFPHVLQKEEAVLKPANVTMERRRKMRPLALSIINTCIYHLSYNSIVQRNTSGNNLNVTVKLLLTNLASGCHYWFACWGRVILEAIDWNLTPLLVKINNCFVGREDD